MSLTLIFGNKNYSSWSLRPWIYLKQNRIEFTEHKIKLDLTNHPFSLPALKPYFSDFKVPVLLDDDFQVWDSLAIMEYLAEKYPKADSWPEDLKARALARAAASEMHSSYDAMRSALPMNCRKFFPEYPISAAVQRDIDRIQNLWEYCGRFKTDGNWIFGNFSIVDAMFAPVVFRLSGYDVKLKPAAQNYCEFVLNNPHIQSWLTAAKTETWVIPEDEV